MGKNIKKYGKDNINGIEKYATKRVCKGKALSFNR